MVSGIIKEWKMFCGISFGDVQYASWWELRHKCNWGKSTFKQLNLNLPIFISDVHDHCIDFSVKQPEGRVANHHEVLSCRCCSPMVTVLRYFHWDIASPNLFCNSSVICKLVSSGKLEGYYTPFYFIQMRYWNNDNVCCGLWNCHY